MGRDSRTTLRGRNASTGRFTKVAKAKASKRTHVVERVPKPGHGDTRRK